MEIKLEEQHCGIHRGDIFDVYKHMPEVHRLIVDTFPENPKHFTWDIKVHMLMPGQYPCIPNWHFDNVPRDKNNNQDFSQVNLHVPMYLWVSNPPLTLFRKDGNITEVTEKTWVRFTQEDEHRGTISESHTWRLFIRATHEDILQCNKPDNVLRRHCQVYLDSKGFTW